MTTAADLSEVLAPIVGLRSGTIERAAGHLSRAGLLPAKRSHLTAEHAAVMLIAAMGSRSPTEAVEAVQIIGALPMATIESAYREQNGYSVGQEDPIRNFPIPPADAGLPYARLVSTFLSAMTVCVEAAIEDGDTMLPSRIAVARNFQMPEAGLEVLLPPMAAMDGAQVYPFHRCVYHYPDSGGQIYRGARDQMAFVAMLPGTAFMTIANFLAGRLGAVERSAAIDPAFHLRQPSGLI
jgi:hypothetical protein